MNRVPLARAKPASGARAKAGRLLLLLLPPAMLLASAGPVTAQPQPTQPEDQGLRVGPFRVSPSFVIKEIGIDSNVFNEAEDPQEDFTATFSPRVDVFLRFGAMRATYTSTLDAVYFKKFKSERSLNRGTEGRLELLLNRLRPFVGAGFLDTNERLNNEIDARAHRTHRHLSAGTAIVLSPRTAIDVSVRQARVKFDEEEAFLGSSLSATMNSDRDTVEAALRFSLTPFTTLAFAAAVEREEFGQSPLRNADSVRFAPVLEFSSSAVISGRASFGYRRFEPDDPALPDFTGVVAAIGLVYAASGRTRVDMAFDRDVRYSFEPEQPYYLITGGRGTFTQHIAGPVDVTLTAGRTRLTYRTRGVLVPDDVDRTDSIDVAGGGLGYHFGDSARFGFNVEWTRRQSDARRDRDYTRRRFFGTLTYGF